MKAWIFLFALMDFQLSFAIHCNLQLNSNAPKTMVRLPFEYASLSDADREKIKFIPERFYTVLDDNTETRAIAGPLQPCIFVGLRNNENGRSIIFHKHFSNSIESLLELAHRKLMITDAKNISGHLFTFYMTSFASNEVMTIHGMQTLKHLHNNRTQEEELKFIKSHIIESFKIKNPDQITETIFFSTTANLALGDYEFAELSVLVDSRLNMKSICFMHEKIFGDFDHYHLHDRRNKIFAALNQIRSELTNKHFFLHFNNESFNSYGLVFFAEL